jgi:hypothetical protein
MRLVLPADAVVVEEAGALHLGLVGEGGPGILLEIAAFWAHPPEKVATTPDDPP